MKFQGSAGDSVGIWRQPSSPVLQSTIRCCLDRTVTRKREKTPPGNEGAARQLQGKAVLEAVGSARALKGMIRAVWESLRLVLGTREGGA